MAHVAVTVEGGLISRDLLEQMAATPQDVPGQNPAAFGLHGRLSDEIQKAFSDALIHWKAFEARLARGKERATTITRETWIVPLLEELGFALTYQRAAAAAGGDTFLISHRLGTDPAAPPVHIVSCEQALDRKGDAARSPHALVQDYLNRSDAVWGIVTNGKALRLLRNTVRFSKPSFIEFDLEAIFDGNLYSEFVLLYRLVHASRLPRAADDAHECWLEKYYQQGIEQGGRVRARLSDGVHQALEILGTGLLGHPESHGVREKFQSGRLAQTDYYRQLLRLIYRLLFLMVAEERRLLFVRDSEHAARQEIYDRWYSIERLRRRADGPFFDDGHSDLWEGLKQTFRLFEDNAHASQLGLTALDGELFGRFACAELIDTKDAPGPKLSNNQLLSAVWQLSTFEDTDGRRRKSGVRRRVNFAGLDVEELGSVYESLLDYRPEVKIDGERSKFALVAGTERKSTGSYYTPPELVRELIKSALEPVIEDRLAKVATREEREHALLSLKICDPASGSGHFLLAAARRLGRELAKVRSGEVEPNPADHRHAIRDVIRRCIYAVDKNPLAVDLCKVALWIEGHEPGLPLSFLDHHVKCGDSLVGLFDLNVLREGVPDDAYKPVTGDDRKVAGDMKKRNKAEARALFRHSVRDSIDRISGAFAEIADLPETSPEEVHSKEAKYAALCRSDEWARAKWACDLWTAAFFAPLTKDGAAAVPTTRNVWEAAGGHLPQGRISALAKDLAAAQPFFHWPIEFPEVFAAGGFDVVLGNPPWERIKLQEQEFFAAREPEISDAPNAAARGKLIAKLKNAAPGTRERALYEVFEAAKRTADASSTFARVAAEDGGRFPLTGRGDVNTYALFAELFAALASERGRAGVILPTGIATDATTAAFFESLVAHQRLLRLISFYEVRRWFSGTDERKPFCLFTIGAAERVTFAFDIKQLDGSVPEEKIFHLTKTEFSLLNPNTKTAPIFRSTYDASLTTKVYRQVPVLIRENEGTSGNPWGVSFRTIFHMANDSHLFQTAAQLSASGASRHGRHWIARSGERMLPLYEGKMLNLYDHRLGTFEGISVRPPPGASLPRPSNGQLLDHTYEVEPWYWVSETNLERFSELHGRQWFFVFRDVTNTTAERTFVGTVIPRSAVKHKAPLLMSSYNPQHVSALIANLSSLILDFVARQKVSGSSMTYFYVKQFPVLPPSMYAEMDLVFVLQRIVQLTYTSHSMAPFAKDLGYEGPPFRWDPNRRALLRAELDAYYAYLYGLTRRELEYILDPKAVMGEDYPSETFRVLKENEIKEFGEYRTQRLVLEAWDRFAVDGTFDPARLREPQYIDRVADELTATREKLKQAEDDSKTLLALASATPKPTLFVEGATDAKILEAAWTVFFPHEPMPVKVIPAGGTKEMGSLAGKGKALREILGKRIVLVLADNDSAGRLLIDDGHLRKGGIWRQLPNGVHWCLLKPSEAFAAAMKAHNIARDYWPFTIEAAFPPTLRRQAAAAGTWSFSGMPQAELLTNPDIAQSLFALVKKLAPGDDAYWFLMAPAPEAKDAFAEWVTDPARRTEENYAAFEEVIRGLRALLARDGNSEPAGRARGAA
jgi:hypothetical protein